MRSEALEASRIRLYTYLTLNPYRHLFGRRFSNGQDTTNNQHRYRCVQQPAQLGVRDKPSCQGVSASVCFFLPTCAQCNLSNIENEGDGWLCLRNQMSRTALVAPAGLAAVVPSSSSHLLALRLLDTFHIGITRATLRHMKHVREYAYSLDRAREYGVCYAAQVPTLNHDSDKQTTSPTGEPENS